MTAERYYVRRPTGKVFGPFDKNAIQIMLKSNKLDAAAEVSRDKQAWFALSEVPDFAHFTRPASAPSGTMMGMAAIRPEDLPRLSDPPELPRAVNRSAELPRPVQRAELPRPVGQRPELPRSTRGAELPRPVGGSAELPRSTQGAELPRPVGGSAELPRPVGGSAELPRPIQHAELPRPVGQGAELPRSTQGAELPRSTQGAELPRPVGQGAELPRSTQSVELPRPVGEPSAALPGPIQRASLPQPVSQDAELPRPIVAPLPRPSRSEPPSARAELPAQAYSSSAGAQQGELAPDEEDLFGVPSSPRGASPYSGEMDEEDLFGEPLSHGERDNPFTSNAALGVEEDDLFGAGSQLSQIDEDDLFGAAPERADSEALFGKHDVDRSVVEDLFSSPHDDALAADDLFGPSDPDLEFQEEPFQRDEEEGDDFLGGSQGFSFLEDESHDAAHSGVSAHGDDAWDRELLGDRGADPPSAGWEEDLLTGNAPPAQPHSSAPYDPGQRSSFDLEAEAPPRQVASSGPPPSQSVPSRGAPAAPVAPAVAPAAPAKKKAKRVAGDSDRKRSRMVLIGLPILALLVMAVAGLAIYRFTLTEQSSVADVVKPVKRFDLSYDELKAPNYAVLMNRLAESREATIEESTRARMLSANALMIALHEDEASRQATEPLFKALESASSPEATLARGALMAVTEGEGEGARALLGEAVQSEQQAVAALAHVMLGVEALRRLDGLREIPVATAQDLAQADLGEAGQGEPLEQVGSPEVNAPSDPRLALEREAQEHFEAAEAWDATLPEHFLGELDELAERFEQSEAHYRLALAASKDFVPANVGLGYALYKQGDLKEALAALERVNTELVQYAHPKDKGAALHYAGMVAFAQSRDQEAIDYFTRALASDPSRSDTLRALAEAYERAGQYKEALNFFRTNEKLSQADPDVGLGIVSAHMNLQEWAQAIAQLEIGEKKFPTDARFPYYLGELNRRRGAFFEAQKSLEKAVEIDPTLLMAHAMLAQLAWRTDQDAARGNRHISEIVSRQEKITARVATEVAEFYRLAGDFGLAKQWYNAAIARDTNFWDARLPLAKLMLEGAETEQALALLERSRDEGVEDIRLAAYLADAYRQSGLYDKAINEINRVIEQVPSKDNAQRAEYIFIRGRIHFDRGNYDTALEDFNQAYTLDTNFYDANFYVGRTKLAQGDTATAIKIFRSVLDYMPNNGEYRFAMGEALQIEERFTQALSEYRKVTELDPGYAARHPKVYIKRGRLLSRLGYSREGREDVQQALRLAPELVDAMIAMGEVDFRDQRYEETIQHLSRALAKDPKHPEAQHKLGMAHIYLEQLRQGVEHLEAAARYEYEDPDIYRTLGYVYKQLGDMANAKRAFNAFLQHSVTAEVPLGTTKEVRRQISELGG